MCVGGGRTSRYDWAMHVPRKMNETRYSILEIGKDFL